MAPLSEATAQTPPRPFLSPAGACIASSLVVVLLVVAAPPAAAEWEAGKAALQKGDYPTAVRELTEAVQSHPDYAPAHYYLGVALKGAGRGGDALAPLRKAVELDPAQPAYGLGLARTFVAVERWGDALEVLDGYDLAALDSKIAGNFTETLAAAASKSDPTEALPLLRGAVEQLPASAALWLALGSRARAAGRHEEALTAYERAAEKDSGDTVAPHQALSTALALAEARQGDVGPWLSRAAQASAQLVRRDPSQANVLLAADTHFKAGRRTEAASYYRTALAKDPKSAAALLGMGRILLEEDDPTGALASLDKAAALAADANLSARIERLRGFTLHGLERYGEAAEAYRRAGDADRAGEMEEYGEIAAQNKTIERKRRECEAKKAEMEKKKAEQKDLFPPAEWAQIVRQMELSLTDCKPYLDGAA